jgi:RNA polymerase subunit RPABC4/transcription elongation factor Spt4
MARDWGIVGYSAGARTVIVVAAVGFAAGASGTGFAQQPSPIAETPTVRAQSLPAPGRAYVNPRRMLLDGPADRIASAPARDAHVTTDFPAPRTHRDLDFFPIAILLAFPFAFALTRAGENVVVTRRHHRLEPETDVARRVSVVVDLATRRSIKARIRQIPKSPRADPYRSVDESALLSVLAALDDVADKATYATLETSLESRRNAAATVASWAEELGLAFRSSSVEMSASLIDEPIRESLPEADRYFVLSVLVHSKSELPIPPSTLDRKNLPAVFGSLVGERGFLEKHHVVWTPADEEEGLTPRELESQHPDLVPLRSESETTLEQKTCRFCAARFATEQTTCPTCGAPEELADERVSLDELIHVADIACRQCSALFPSDRYKCPECGANRFTLSGRPPPVERASSAPADPERRSTPPPKPPSLD